jgi:PKHD-type hydroxylase
MLYVDSENIREDLERKEKAIDLSNYYYQPNFLSQKEIDFLIEIAEDKTQRATTFSGESNEKRRSNVGWISPKEDGRDNSWVFQKISALASAANKHMYNFDICGMYECLQYTVYNGDEKGFYCAHVDHGKNFYKRKLSIVIQLTDPAEYEGGDLLTITSDSPNVVPKGLGMAVIFPSWMLHEVTPVTSGTRRSLVCWISGPPFR